MFRHFFHDFENEQQMRIAEEYCHKELNTNCNTFVEAIRYDNDQDVLHYFLNKMKTNFHKGDSIININRVIGSKFLIYEVILSNISNLHETYYFDIGCFPYEGDYIKLIDPSERKLYLKSPFKPLFFPCCIDNIFNEHLKSLIYEVDTNIYTKSASVIKDLTRITQNPDKK